MPPRPRTRRYVLALDQGTTSSRAIVFDRMGRVVASAQREFRQRYPRPGWVEHHPEDIWGSQLEVARAVLRRSDARAGHLAAIGITNQRETVLVWERASGKPIYPAIVWQDRRTAPGCDQLRREGLGPLIRRKTGLVIDPYFSATKLRWILDHVPSARRRARAGKLAFGTVDTWLLWCLSGGKRHVTEVTNAARTMLFNIHTLEWDDALLEIFQIPRALLPEVRSSGEVLGETRCFGGVVPVAGMAGDQQAALLGQGCIRPGMAKHTYGTGGFLVLNTGRRPVLSRNRLLTTIAWKIGDRVDYALEGSIFVAGAAVQWLRDGLGLIPESGAIEEVASRVADNGGVYLVPAFAGLGAPYWDPYARGSIHGLTRGTTAAHLARATLEAIAFQVRDVVVAMEADTGLKFAALRADGGACVNNLLMQIQADLLGRTVTRPRVTETTALGAAFLAGLAVGVWDNRTSLTRLWREDRVFHPQLAEPARQRLVADWRRAVSRSRRWAEPDTA